MKHSFKKATLIAVLLTASTLTTQAAEETEGTSWVEEGFAFNPELSSTGLAQQWALCSATLKVFSGELKKVADQSATAKLIEQTANGASVAIIGTYVLGFAKNMDDLDKDTFTQRFKEAVEYGQFASVEFVDKAMVFVAAQEESAANDQAWMENLTASAMDCMQPPVLEMQEMLINTVRETVMGVPK